jgi:hypothetical protein
MDFSKLTEYLVTRTFEAKDASGQVVDACAVTYDANKYSGELDRRMGSLYAERAREFGATYKLLAAQGPKKKGKQKEDGWDALASDFEQRKERDARLADLRKEVLADALACDRYALVRAWGMELTEESAKKAGMVPGPVPPTFENMMRLPEGTLEALLNLGRGAGAPETV